MNTWNRRDFSLHMGKGVLATGLLGATSLKGMGQMKKNKDSLGIALVGLGSYSTYQLAPAYNRRPIAIWLPW